jgi:glycosyltransferase involved in cell wall biosynthesis
MRISLCVIAGNEEHHIGRMLDSFAPCFDELSLVRAIGSKKADRTLSIARDWCEQHRKDFIFREHVNQVGTEAWDHVDSFGAARNEAFRQASGEWLIWSDCDDVMQSAEILRPALETVTGDVTMVRFQYDVRGTGKKLYRERAIRREKFHAGRVWHHDVHENLLMLPGDRHLDLPDPVWLHAPLEVKRENRARNLRILKNSVRETASQYYYIHQEHYCAGNHGPAVEFGKVALSMPNLNESFRYEAHLNIARVCGDHREAVRNCLEAHGVFPWCREALAALVLLYFEKRDTMRAHYWAERMMERQEPPHESRPWTHERKWYGWAGLDLAARAARYGNRPDRAEMFQRAFFAGQKPKISLIHATRGRSSKAVACRDAWLNAAANPSQIEHVFAVDADDAESLEMSKQFVSVVSDAKSCVAAWNLGARKATGDLLIQLSDDWFPCPGWDDQLLALVEGKDLTAEQVVIAVNDGHRKDDLLCMAILSRARWVAQGDMFFPGYESVFSDNEFSLRAFRDGVVIDARDRITFVHSHPVFRGGELDDTYKHNNRRDRYESGQKLFKERNP